MSIHEPVFAQACDAVELLGGARLSWLSRAFCRGNYVETSSTPHAIQADFDLKHVFRSAERRIVCVILGLAPAAVLGFGLMRLRRSFLCFARGELFSYRAIAGLKDFAAASTASVIVAVVVTPLTSIVVGWRGAGDMETAFRSALEASPCF